MIKSHGDNILKNLKITTFLCMTVLLIPILLFSYEGHKDSSPPKTETIQPYLIEDQAPKLEESSVHIHNHDATELDNGYEKFIKWIGNFHPIAIHFPIALIIMSAFAEFLFILYPYPIFSHSSRFMIVAAAITAPLAALLGLAYGYDANYSGVLSDIFWWHRFLGISTAILAFITALINELNVRKIIENSLWYRIALFISVILVTITGFLGGEMTFGLYNLFP